jgi:hypothetical protein
MMLVQAIERRNSAGRPSLLTVRISSNPSRMLFETPGGVSLQALGEIADQFLRLRRIVGFPGLCFGTEQGPRSKSTYHPDFKFELRIVVGSQSAPVETPSDLRSANELREITKALQGVSIQR